MDTQLVSQGQLILQEQLTSQGQLFSQGLNLLILGMGFVFIFLVFLVFAMKGMSGILMRCQPIPATSPAGARRSKPNPASQPTQASDDQLVAVLAAAIHHRKITS